MQIKACQSAKPFKSRHFPQSQATKKITIANAIFLKNGMRKQSIKGINQMNIGKGIQLIAGNPFPIHKGNSQRARDSIA
jgi:hypothetical protein